MQPTIEPTTLRNSRTDDPVGRTLLDDLIELASYYRGRGLDGCELTDTELRFLVGLIRYRFSPPEGTILSQRGHIMVFGGAGAGKSTTSNILSGTECAEVNSQAGYTRHPTAIYLPSDGDPPETWPDKLGDLRCCDRAQPGSLDADRFSTRVPDSNPVDPEFLRAFVVWDCPDLTTRDSTHYVGRVVEIAALADLCVYVASDERYNDELPTAFLQAVLAAGKPTLVVLTKVSEFDAEELVSLFRQQVLARMRCSELVLDVYPVPTPLRGKIGELWTSAFPHGARLRGSVRESLVDLAGVRASAAEQAIRYVADREDSLLKPLASDVGHWRAWAELVRRSAHTAITRYEAEYLDRWQGEDFSQSHELLLRAMAPGRANYVWRTLEYLRVPYRILKTMTARYMDRGSVGGVDESALLESIREHLYDSLVLAVATRRASDPFWEALHSDLLKREELAMDAVFRDRHAQQTRLLRSRSREAIQKLEERLAESAWFVRVLQAARLLLDVAAIAGAIYVGYLWSEGFHLWIMVLVLAAVGIVDDLVRLACHAVVRRQREEIIATQKQNIRELIQSAYVDVLTRLPKGLGERLERLSGLCSRIPQSLRILSRQLSAGRPAGDSP